MEETTGIIILAAGNSSRLGQPKQLLKYKEFTLLRNVVLQAKLVPKSNILVVTGAYKEIVDKELADTAVKIINNPNWETGMASSITIGLETLCAINPKVKSCIFSVCDQPFLKTNIFNELLEAQSIMGKGIAASAYAGILGVPVLFTSHYFEELLNLEGNEGAKKLLQHYKNDVAEVSFEKGAIDIDTIEDYNRLLSQDKI
jgi:molybdenum cofactor cytidylyltransferase